MSGYEQKWEWFMGGENPKKQQGGECSFFLQTFPIIE